MSLLRPKLPRLALVAMTLILMGALVAAPSVSGAKNAVKQFTASISVGGAAGSFTETVTNCGGPTLPAECNASSTIDLGAVRITVPTEFQPIDSVSAVTPGGTIWNASYNTTTKTINVISPGGSNKLKPGGSLLITFHTTSSTTCEGTKTFTTAAWGSNSISGSDPFEIKSPQPTVACLGSGGGTVIGPGGQTETVSGDFDGTLIVTFGGDLNCGIDIDPTFGSQWSQFHLPTQVNITPGPGFDPGEDPKISTSKFPAGEADSSSYLICWAGLDTFNTRSGIPPEVVEIGGTDFFVGILPNCYDPITGDTRPEPCVSEQFLELTTNKIVISVRMPPGDPHKR
jgi:type II secretory pathway pseudopilin PulG